MDAGPAKDLLDARIRLELQYRDLETSDAVKRLDIDVPGRVETLVAQTGDRDSLADQLALSGLDWDDLEALALRMEVASAWTRDHLLPRIVVTGSSGFLGRHLLDATKDYYRIAGIARRSQLISGAPHHPNIQWHQADIADRAMDEYYELTGRRYARAMGYRLDDADYVFVGQGSVVRDAEAVALWLREQRRIRVGLGEDCRTGK